MWFIFTIRVFFFFNVFVYLFLRFVVMLALSAARCGLSWWWEGFRWAGFQGLQHTGSVVLARGLSYPVYSYPLLYFTLKSTRAFQVWRDHCCYPVHLTLSHFLRFALLIPSRVKDLDDNAAIQLRRQRLILFRLRRLLRKLY